jgi:hypothetical protein
MHLFGCLATWSLCFFLADKKVENICIVQSTAQLHPVVASFLRRAVEKLESASSYTTMLPCGEDVSTNRKAPVCCLCIKNLFVKVQAAT